MAEGVLDKIAAAKCEELALRYDGVSLDALRARAVRRGEASPPPSPSTARASFSRSRRRRRPRVRSGPDADPAALARGFAGVADALSVLCDRPSFGGSLDDLAAARGEFDGPILAKDFFIDSRQIAEARIAARTPCWSMLSLLDDDGAGDDRRGAPLRHGRAGRSPRRAEMRRALALGAPLIGINNRDLRDLSIDLATTERLASSRLTACWSPNPGSPAAPTSKVSPGWSMAS